MFGKILQCHVLMESYLCLEHDSTWIYLKMSLNTDDNKSEWKDIMCSFPFALAIKSNHAVYLYS